MVIPNGFGSIAEPRNRSRSRSRYKSQHPIKRKDDKGEKSGIRINPADITIPNLDAVEEINACFFTMTAPLR
jgi:hypothetical protein